MLSSLAGEGSPRRRGQLFGTYGSKLAIRIGLLALLSGIPAASHGAPAGRADETQKLLDKGIEQYNYGLFEESLVTLGRAAKATGDPRLLGEIHLYRAINYAVLDKGALARQAFNEALSNNPRLVLDSERFKESIVNIFQSVKREREKYAPAAPSVAPAPAARAPAASRPATPPAVAPSGPVGPSAVRPGTRSLALSLALGGALGLDSSPSQFKLRQTFDVHFSGASSGIGIGLFLAQSLGGDGVILQAGPRLLWDIQLSSGAALYLSPDLGVGLTFVSSSPTGRYGANEDILGVTAALGLELKLILADRVLLFLRPVGLELIIGGEGLDTADGLFLRYDLLLGVGVTL